MSETMDPESFSTIGYGTMSTIDSIKLLADLLNILQGHNWRDESAADTLKRIIRERDTCTAALRVVYDTLRDHTRQP